MNDTPSARPDPTPCAGGPDAAAVDPVIANLRHGSPGAADALLRRFEPWLRILARSRIESRFQAKFAPSDVVQQTMIEAIKAFPAFRGSTEAQLAAWLRQILARVLAHEIRRYQGTGKRDLAREISLDQELTGISQRLGDLLPAEATSPTDAAHRLDRQRQLAALLEGLPDDYRTVLVLRHLEGLSHDEIAHRLGRQPGAVRMLWVRALARLRRDLGNDPGPG